MIFSQKNFPMPGSGDERRTAILFRCCLVSLFISLAGTAIMEAQEVEFAVPDGLMLKKDPFSFRLAGIQMLLHPEFPTFRKQMPMIYFPESETEEERAARINALTMNRVMKSVDMHLNRYRTSRYANLFGGRLSISGLFLNTPFGTDSFGTGKRWMPLMNPSYPFLYIQVPGMSPSINPYAPDNSSQCIRTEYDLATGTYKQVMTDWSKVQKDIGYYDRNGSENFKLHNNKMFRR